MVVYIAHPAPVFGTPPRGRNQRLGFAVVRTPVTLRSTPLDATEPVRAPCPIGHVLGEGLRRDEDGLWSPVLGDRGVAMGAAAFAAWLRDRSGGSDFTTARFAGTPLVAIERALPGEAFPRARVTAHGDPEFDPDGLRSVVHDARDRAASMLPGFMDREVRIVGGMAMARVTPCLVASRGQLDVLRTLTLSATTDARPTGWDWMAAPMSDHARIIGAEGSVVLTGLEAHGRIGSVPEAWDAWARLAGPVGPSIAGSVANGFADAAFRFAASASAGATLPAPDGNLGDRVHPRAGEIDAGMRAMLVDALEATIGLPGMADPHAALTRIARMLELSLDDGTGSTASLPVRAVLDGIRGFLLPGLAARPIPEADAEALRELV